MMRGWNARKLISLCFICTVHVFDAQSVMPGPHFIGSKTNPKILAVIKANDIPFPALGRSEQTVDSDFFCVERIVKSCLKPPDSDFKFFITRDLVPGCSPGFYLRDLGKSCSGELENERERDYHFNKVLSFQGFFYLIKNLTRPCRMAEM